MVHNVVLMRVLTAMLKYSYSVHVAHSWCYFCLINKLPFHVISMLYYWYNLQLFLSSVM
nr:MAG TPA: hypothetical protein [Caudoviricetes sp.]